jgi:hypothetical protein
MRKNLATGCNHISKSEVGNNNDHHKKSIHMGICVVAAGCPCNDGSNNLTE